MIRHGKQGSFSWRAAYFFGRISLVTIFGDCHVVRETPNGRGGFWRFSDVARFADVGLRTIRDWVLRFNAKGRDGLIDGTSPGAPALLQRPQGSRQHNPDAIALEPPRVEPGRKHPAIHARRPALEPNIQIP